MRFCPVSIKSRTRLFLHGLLAVFISLASLSVPHRLARADSEAGRVQNTNVVFANPTTITVSDAPPSNTPPGKGTPYPSNITVAGLGTSLTSLTVTLTNVNHAFPSDLDVLLVGPTGQSFILQSDAGGNLSAVNRSYTFDDNATTQLSDSGGLQNGTFKPANHQGNDGTNDVFPAPAPAGPHGNPGPQSSGSATLTSTFGGTNPNGVWSLYVTDDENIDAGNIAGGWSLSISAVFINPALSRVSDFDGDNKTDLAVVRDTGGSSTWYINRSTDGFLAQGWGIPTDVFVPQDYDGDGKSDIAVWRGSNGYWYIFQSQTFTLLLVNFGTSGDNPRVVDDYDGDGKADPAVVRNSGGLKIWYYLGSSSGFAFKQWGLSTDAPAPGDYDGDGKADFAVRRNDVPAAGLATFYIDGSTSGFQFANWGNNTDIIVPGDYDGDQKTDIAVAHPSGTDLFWYVRLSGGGIIENVRWGLTSDFVTQGDYNGDSKTDIAVWRPSSGYFYITLTGSGFTFTQWGQTGDYPPANSNSY
jgi:subtilisin-like proprotein convertase family protein